MLPVPVSAAERVESIDVLRGFSLLGILLLNIAAFGMPFAAYSNPSVYGGDTGANHAVWLLAVTMWDGKMRAIFSMLFGASSLLLLERAERRGAGIAAADIYYRRLLWLILIGLFHAHLIWSGDILYSYAVVGLLLFPLRKLSAKALIIAGTAICLIHTGQNVGAAFGIQELSGKAKEVAQAVKEGKPLTKEQKKVDKEWNELRSFFDPPKEDIQEQVKTHRSGWIANLGLRSGEAAMIEFTMFFQFMFLDVLGMLVLGMGLHKAGVFDASRSSRFYLLLIAAGLGIGAPLNYWAASKWAASGYGIPEGFLYGSAAGEVGRFLVAGAYIGIIMLIVKSGSFPWITHPLQAVGRTALSNYLLTSILCTFFFNGYGLGMFGKLERAQLYGVVLGMWTINLTLSPLWLRYYRFGPAEWAWRSLTYWQRQPMKKEKAATAVMPGGLEEVAG